MPTAIEGVAVSAKRSARRVMSRLKGAREFWRDMRRYYRYSTPAGTESFGALSGRNLECQVTKDYHRIEKGLALPSPRQPFGGQVRERLTVLMRADKAPGDYSRYAAEAVVALDEWNSSGIIDPVVSPAGETIERATIQRDDLERFFSSRRSVRAFDAAQPVSRETVRNAVALAINTPSVCNRQAWRVHVFYGDEAQSILKHHNGSRAFAADIPAVAIVTSDNRLFSGSGERNQRWIDGGLFAMSLVWALHGLGMATCMLNWSRINSASDSLRRTASLDDAEEIIVLVGLGHPKENYRVARSSRRQTDSVLIEHS